MDYSSDRFSKGFSRRLSFCALCISLLGAAGAHAASETQIQLMKMEPYRLIVDSNGKPQKLVINGANFEEAVQNRDQHMHWQIRRSDGVWQRCGHLTPDCRSLSGNALTQEIEIGGAFVSREGQVELRVFRGAGAEDIMDPSQARKLVSGWSNVLRVPVVVPAVPPAIKSLSKTEFPIDGKGKPEDYRFTINTSGIEGQGRVVVVFGMNTPAETVVDPQGIAGNLVHVAIPENHRSTIPGTVVSFSLRTDRGGLSPGTSIKFVPPAQRVAVGRPASTTPVTAAD